jgi:GNAT superfamily N-acetyltransferase
MSITFQQSPLLSNAELNALFVFSWPGHEDRDFQRELAQSLTWVGAFDAERLVGFVKVAWDGGLHAFLLDPTTHPDFRRRGVGRGMVSRAADTARERGVEWLHVDFEISLTPFYRACGFVPTEAGLLHLTTPST